MSLPCHRAPLSGGMDACHPKTAFVKRWAMAGCLFPMSSMNTRTMLGGAAMASTLEPSANRTVKTTITFTWNLMLHPVMRTTRVVGGSAEYTSRRKHAVTNELGTDHGLARDEFCDNPCRVRISFAIHERANLEFEATSRMWPEAAA